RLRKRVDKRLQVASAEVQDTTPNKQPSMKVVAEEQADFDSQDHSLDNSQKLDDLQNSTLIAALKNSSDAIITIDEQFFVRDLNSSALKLLAVSSQNGIGHKCTEILCCKNLNRMLLCG